MSFIQTHELPFPMEFTIPQQMAIERGIAHIGHDAIMTGGSLTQVDSDFYAIFDGRASLCICQHSEDLAAGTAFEYLPVHWLGGALAIKDELGRLCLAHLVRCVKSEGARVEQDWRLVFWSFLEFRASLLDPAGLPVAVMMRPYENRSHSMLPIAV